MGRLLKFLMYIGRGLALKTRAALFLDFWKVRATRVKPPFTGLPYRRKIDNGPPEFRYSISESIWILFWAVSIYGSRHITYAWRRCRTYLSERRRRRPPVAGVHWSRHLRHNGKYSWLWWLHFRPISRILDSASVCDPSDAIVGEKQWISGRKSPSGLFPAGGLYLVRC